MEPAIRRCQRMLGMLSLTVFALSLPSGTSQPLANRCVQNSERHCASSVGMPNLAGHTDIEVAVSKFRQFDQLIQYGCPPEFRPFFCSVFLPECTNGTAVPPCHDFCTAVRDDCSPLLHEFGMPWPDVVECSRFPHRASGTSCVELSGPQTTTTEMSAKPMKTVGSSHREGRNRKGKPGLKTLQKDVLSLQGTNLRLEQDLLKLQIEKLKLELGLN